MVDIVFDEYKKSSLKEEVRLIRGYRVRSRIRNNKYHQYQFPPRLQEQNGIISTSKILMIKKKTPSAMTTRSHWTL